MQLDFSLCDFTTYKDRSTLRNSQKNPEKRPLIIDFVQQCTRQHEENLAEIVCIYFPMWRKKVHLTLPGMALLFQLHFCGWHVKLAAI